MRGRKEALIPMTDQETQTPKYLGSPFPIVEEVIYSRELPRRPELIDPNNRPDKYEFKPHPVMNPAFLGMVLLGILAIIVGLPVFLLLLAWMGVLG